MSKCRWALFRCCAQCTFTPVPAAAFIVHYDAVDLLNKEHDSLDIPATLAFQACLIIGIQVEAAFAKMTSQMMSTPPRRALLALVRSGSTVIYWPSSAYRKSFQLMSRPQDILHHSRLAMLGLSCDGTATVTDKVSGHTTKVEAECTSYDIRIRENGSARGKGNTNGDWWMARCRESAQLLKIDASLSDVSYSLRARAL